MRKAGFFDESLRAAQDHDMAIRIAEITRLAYVSESIFYYRRHSDSISVKRYSHIMERHEGVDGEML